MRVGVFVGLLVGFWIASSVQASDAVRVMGVDPQPTDPAMNNPWPAEWEQVFWERAEHAVAFWKGQRPRGGTYGENEKNYYPTAMWAYLTGDKATAIKAFEEPDHVKADHAYTNNVDFYWCFTLKGQMRKYFYFGKTLNALSPEYMETFKDGARKWLQTDPMTTEHPVHGKGKGGGPGWGPEIKGRRVDGRNTDNLRAMRDISVYLMAEEVGAADIRDAYAAKINRYVATLYNIGMSEWDSPNYHGHTISAYHNLYDFAADPKMKLTAKAALDWLYAAGAVKYAWGGFAGPNARDYGHRFVFGPNVIDPLWLYFGDTPIAPTSSDRDDAHHLTSSYRPPVAVVELARKNFSRPVEIFATKPAYRNWDGQPQAPEFFETSYIASSYQIGTVVSAGTGGPWNINSFGMIARSRARGADYIVANSKSVLGHMVKNAGDQVAQYRNVVIWLRPNDGTPIQWQLPRSAKFLSEGGVTFIELDETWIALHPINLGAMQAADIEKQPDDQVYTAQPDGGKHVGFAMEIGEAESHQSFDTFRRAVLAGKGLDRSQIDDGVARYTSTDGRRLELHHSVENNLPEVVRDGKRIDYAQRIGVWESPDGSFSPILQRHMGGELTVQAGGQKFVGRFDEQNGYQFQNSKVD